MPRMITQATPIRMAPDYEIYIGRFGAPVCVHCFGLIEVVQGLSQELYQHQADHLTVCNATPVEPLVQLC